MLFKNLRDEIDATRARDPAARSSLEVVFCYPGFQALLFHRLAHWLWAHRWYFLGRFVAHVGRVLTAIDIHPGATIGKRLFIDHGIGVVVGETAEIGDDVTLYQGVTLGGTGFATGKRHPTVEDNVTIGSGAKLLGPIVVGHGAKIGANSVVIHDVPPNSTVVGNPGHPVRIEGRRPEGPDADWIHLPDPVADAIRGLSTRIAALETGDGNGELAESAVASSPHTGDRAELDGRANPSLGPNPAGG
jgi:serine O-acetyltransferase